VAAAAILDFQKLKILTVDLVPGANMRHHAKFHQDRSQIYGDLTVFFKMAAVRHVGLVGRLLGTPTMTT